jgi:Mor family transcriptional regulator
MPRNSDRNRRIYAAFAQGRTMEQLGEEFALSCQRVRALLTDEQHRRTVSVEPFYRALRGT